MPDQRTNQTVAERLELRLERFPNPLHRRRRWFTLAGGLLPALLVGFFFARGDHTVFLAGPVAESHQHFQDDCQECHRTPWQPLVRLASADSSARSVRDEDCQQCHAQDKSDHHASALAKGVPDCVACHQEHQGTVRLTRDADRSCVRCHRPFESHPQFALLRSWSLDGDTNAPPTTAGVEAKVQTLERIATLVRSGATGATGAANWRDKAALKFSHAGHRSPLVTALRREAGGPATPLGCEDCHQPDADGHYMRPIVFEQHCQSCHPLRFSSKLDLATATAADNVVQGLPHEVPEIVRSVMRERLIANAPQSLQAAGSSPDRPPSRLPHKEPTPTKAEWEWVNAELRVLENAIFGEPAEVEKGATSNACLKCHFSADDTSDGSQSRGNSAAFAIVPPRIPSRWMPQSHFRHDRHLHMKCVDCHPGAAAAETTEGDPTGAVALRTNGVPNILMPSIDNCRNCHGADSASDQNVRPARSNCTECHQYHHQVPTQPTRP